VHAVAAPLLLLLGFGTRQAPSCTWPAGVKLRTQDLAQRSCLCVLGSDRHSGLFKNITAVACHECLRGELLASYPF
jgi:hypothetical protein